MSDTQQGADWWQGTDGKWYPPAQPAGVTPPPQTYRPAQTNSNAVLSLVLGLVGMFACGLVLGIPAILLGGKAKQEIRESGGSMTGEGLATAGIVLGWIATIVSTLILFLVFGISFLGRNANTKLSQVSTSLR